MSAPVFQGLVEEARAAARTMLSSAGRIRLNYSLAGDDMWRATSPDIDWLVVTAHSQGAARLMAMTAVLRVANWCDADIRTLPR